MIAKRTLQVLLEVRCQGVQRIMRILITQSTYDKVLQVVCDVKLLNQYVQSVKHFANAHHGSLYTEHSAQIHSWFALN